MAAASGRQVLEWIVTQYSDSRRFRLEVTQMNQGAAHLYEKCGFQYEGTIRQGFRRYDGQSSTTCATPSSKRSTSPPQRFQPQAVKIPKDFEKKGKVPLIEMKGPLVHWWCPEEA